MSIDTNILDLQINTLANQKSLNRETKVKEVKQIKQAESQWNGKWNVEKIAIRDPSTEISFLKLLGLDS